MTRRTRHDPMSAWSVIPDRQPGSRLSNTDFSFRSRPARGDAAMLRTLPNVEGYTSRFRHHDNRVWVAEIDPIFSLVINETLDGDFNYSVSLVSQGCRAFQFVAENFSKAKSVVRRFANMGQSRYERITADAQGTADHPRTDDIGVFRMFVTKYQPRSFDRRELTHTQVTGIGRLTGSTLSMFPTTDELEDIFTRVCPFGVVALIPSGINQIGSTNGATFTNGNLQADVPAPTEFDPEIIHTVLNRNFNDSFADISTSVTAGDFTPRRREERVINLGDDDDEN